MQDKCVKLRIWLGLIVVVLSMATFSENGCAANKNKSKVLGIGEVISLQEQDGTVVTGQAITASKKWKFTSSNKAVATVNARGEVWAKKTGKVKVKARHGKQTKTYSFTVNKKGLRYSSFTMLTGESLKLYLSPKRKHCIYSSSNSSVVKVDHSGIMKALNKGKSWVSVTANQKRYRIQVRVEKNPKKVIYLTFDDGPSSSTTPVILDILKKQGVKATFFTIAYDKVCEPLIKRMVAEGHTVAIHGQSHDYKAIYRSQKAYLNNVYKQQKRIEKTTGIRSYINRFPGGSSNGVSKFNKGIMTKLTRKMLKEGFTYFDWNISSGDASGHQSPEGAYKSVVKNLRPGQNNVVLMHDFSGNSATMKALERIIQYGKSEGYEFRAITESTSQVHHHILN